MNTYQKSVFFHNLQFISMSIYSNCIVSRLIGNNSQPNSSVAETILINLNRSYTNILELKERLLGWVCAIIISYFWRWKINFFRNGIAKKNWPIMWKSSNDHLYEITHNKNVMIDLTSSIFVWTIECEFSSSLNLWMFSRRKYELSVRFCWSQCHHKLVSGIAKWKNKGYALTVENLIDFDDLEHKYENRAHELMNFDFFTTKWWKAKM